MRRRWQKAEQLQIPLSKWTLEEKNFEEEHSDLEEGSEDVSEHDDINAKERQFPDEGQQVEPGHCHTHGTLGDNEVWCGRKEVYQKKIFEKNNFIIC